MASTTIPRARPASAGLTSLRRVDVIGLVVLTVVLRLPAYFAERALTFDDANFGASAIAMREGGVPFGEVFSSQGPAFLPLVWLGDLIGLRTLYAPRTLNLLAGIALVLVVHHLARRFCDRGGALLAAALVSTTGSVLWVTTPVAADGPAIALGALAVALALSQRDRPTTGRAVALGLAVGLALSTKAILVSAVVPVAVVLVVLRRPRLLVTAAATSVAVFAGLALAFGFSDVIDQSVTYHLDKDYGLDPGGNVSKLASTAADRDLPLLALGGSTLVGAGIAARRAGRLGVATQAWKDRLRAPSDELVVGIWLLATLALLVYQTPLWRPYLSHLGAPAALLVARYRPSWRVVAVVAVLALPYHWLHLDGYLTPAPYDQIDAALVEELEALPDDGLVISDDTGLVWWAGRRTPDDLVDPSFLRIDAGRITEAGLAEAAAAPAVCAVVTWSDEHYLTFEGLTARLEDLGYEPTGTWPDEKALYLRPTCDQG